MTDKKFSTICHIKISKIYEILFKAFILITFVQKTYSFHKFHLIPLNLLV